MSSTDPVNAARDRMIGGMCVTARHDFGLMNEKDRAFLRREMDQLVRHNVDPVIDALTTERDHWKTVAEMNATSGAFTFKHLGIAHEALARAEAERDALRKEVEELKHDLARYVDIATEHVNEVEEWPALIKIMIDQARTNSGSVPMDERQRDAYLSALCHIEIGIDNAVEYRRRARAALVDAEKGGE